MKRLLLAALAAIATITTANANPMTMTITGQAYYSYSYGLDPTPYSFSATGYDPFSATVVYDFGQPGLAVTTMPGYISSQGGPSWSVPDHQVSPILSASVTINGNSYQINPIGYSGIGGFATLSAGIVRRVRNADGTR
jgi:hypothetical protein